MAKQQVDNAGETEERNKQQKIKALLERILALPVSSLEQYGLVPHGGAPTTLTKAELILMQLVERGCNGELSAIREILDRLLGKPVQTHNQNLKADVTYYDFLMSIVHDEQKERKIISVPKKVNAITAQPQLETAESTELEDDLFS